MTVNGEKELIVVPEVVKTTNVVFVAPQEIPKLVRLLVAVGVTDEVKKREGYIKVTVSPEGMGVLDMKVKVTSTEDLPAMRSEEAIEKTSDET